MPMVSFGPDRSCLPLEPTARPGQSCKARSHQTPKWPTAASGCDTALHCLVLPRVSFTQEEREIQGHPSLNLCALLKLHKAQELPSLIINHAAVAVLALQCHIHEWTHTMPRQEANSHEQKIQLVKEKNKDQLLREVTFQSNRCNISQEWICFKSGTIPTRRSPVTPSTASQIHSRVWNRHLAY